MELNLRNPIVFFDLETTGTNILKDRIVEISIIKVFPNGTEYTRTYRINPETPIPAEASAIHGIYDTDVANEPTFKMLAHDIAEIFSGADIAGYNSNKFDVPLLAEEFLRAGVTINLAKHKFVDVQTIFHKMEQRTLVAAYKFYCGKELDNAHSALADTRATYEVLKAQLDHYPALKNDIDFLSSFSSHNKNADLAGRIVYNGDGREVFNFGKYKGMDVEDVFRKEPGYYNWMMQGEFAANTKQVITGIKLRIK